MDAVGLTILAKEMAADCAVARDAAQSAARDLSRSDCESCISEMSRFYNVLERMLERIYEYNDSQLKKSGVNLQTLQRADQDYKFFIRRSFIPFDGEVDLLYLIDFLKMKRPMRGFAFAFRHGNEMLYRDFKKSAAIVEWISAELATWCANFEASERKKLP